MRETALAAAASGPPPRLSCLFEALDGAAVRWSLLRPPLTLAEGAGDIDLLVEPASMGRVRDVLIDHGFVPIPAPGPDLHTADYDAARNRFLWLHVQSELRVAGETVPASTVLAAVERDPLPRPRDPWLLWIVLLHGVVDKGVVAERHRPTLKRLARAPGAEECPLVALATRRGVPPHVVLPLVAAGEWQRLEQLPVVHGPVTRALPNRLADASDRIRGLWTRRGVGVAVIGPDGVGKTTLVNCLRDALPFPTRILYMGLTGGRLPRADAIRIPGLVFAARLAILWVRYGVGLYHRLRGRIVLFDRYVLDGTVPSGATLGPLARMSRRIQAAACPLPDVVLLLDASGATMHHRKGEYDGTTLETWRAAYSRLRGSVDRLQVVDAERPADAVCRDALARIWHCYAERWRPRSAAGP